MNHMSKIFDSPPDFVVTRKMLTEDGTWTQVLPADSVAAGIREPVYVTEGVKQMLVGAVDKTFLPSLRKAAEESRRKSERSGFSTEHPFRLSGREVCAVVNQDQDGDYIVAFLPRER